LTVRVSIPVFLARMRIVVDNDVKEIAKEHDLRRIVLSKETPQPSLQQLGAAAQACLLNADEEFVRILPERSKTDVRFLVVTVHGDEIVGLPVDAPAGLVAAVRDAARRSSTDKRVEVKGAPVKSNERSPAIDVALSAEDIVLDGGAHRRLIGSILRAAHHRVVVHSTFLSVNGVEHGRGEVAVPRFEACWPLSYRKSAKRPHSGRAAWGTERLSVKAASCRRTWLSGASMPSRVPMIVTVTSTSPCQLVTGAATAFNPGM
jgi:hypothetical protein